MTGQRPASMTALFRGPQKVCPRPRNPLSSVTPARPSRGVTMRSAALLAAAALAVAPAVHAADNSARVYELRSYTAAPGKLDNVNARFRDHTCKLFEKHGMTNVGYWTPTKDQKGADNTLVYLLAHKS